MSVDLGLLVVGGAVLGLGVLSGVLKRVWLSVPLAAMMLGLVLGPQATGLLDPGRLGDARTVLEEVARITLSVSLVATGLQLTSDDLKENWRRTGSLLTIAMVGMWLVTSLGVWLILDLPWVLALVVGGILTPTDPVVASTLVTGRLAEANLPRWVRRTLQAESGANDGLALIFVLAPLLVFVEPQRSAGGAIAETLGQVGLAVVIGSAVGFVMAKVVTFAVRAEEVSPEFEPILAVGLGLATLGLVHLLGGTGILASFLAGLVFSITLTKGEREELSSTQSVVEQLLLIPVFVLFGTLLPIDGWASLGWTGAAFAAWVLLARRPVAAALALAPTRSPLRGVAFLSWFGPVGVAGIYYLTFVGSFGLDAYERIFASASLAIALSVLVQSVTAAPAARRYAGRRASTTLRHPFTAGIEHAP